MSDSPVQDLLHDQRSGLMRLARGLVYDEHAAEDVVQDAFVAALGGRLDAPKRVGGWLRGAARLVASNLRRSQRRRVEVESAASRDELQPATVDVVVREQMLLDVTNAVLALSPEQRAVVLMRFFWALLGGEAPSTQAATDVEPPMGEPDLIRWQTRSEGRFELDGLPDSALWIAPGTATGTTNRTSHCSSTAPPRATAEAASECSLRRSVPWLVSIGPRMED